MSGCIRSGTDLEIIAGNRSDLVLNFTGGNLKVFFSCFKQCQSIFYCLELHNITAHIREVDTSCLWKTPVELRLVMWLEHPTEAWRGTVEPSLPFQGCDSGFGHVLAKRLSEMGVMVFAGVLDVNGAGAQQLREPGSENLQVLQLDVTDSTQIETAHRYICAQVADTGKTGGRVSGCYSRVKHTYMIIMITLFIRPKTTVTKCFTTNDSKRWQEKSQMNKNNKTG